MKENHEAHKECLRKEKERYKRRKAAGKTVNIGNLPTRDQRSFRRKWRNEKKQQRQNGKRLDETCHFTPPRSPDVPAVPAIREPSTSMETLQSHKKKQAGRKRVMKESIQNNCKTEETCAKSSEQSTVTDKEHRET